MKKLPQHKVHAMNAVILAAQYQGPTVSIPLIAPLVGIHPQNLKTYLRRHLRVSLSTFRSKFKSHLTARIVERSPKTMPLSNILPVVGISSIILLTRHFKREFGMDLRTYQKHFGGTQTLQKDANLSNDILADLCKQYFIP